MISIRTINLWQYWKRGDSWDFNLFDLDLHSSLFGNHTRIIIFNVGFNISWNLEKEIKLHRKSEEILNKIKEKESA